MRLSFILIVCLIINNKTQAQLVADAGADTVQCSTTFPSNLIIGGAPTAYGGTPPYTYEWGPSGYFINPFVANPTILGYQSVMANEYTFFLKVTDAANNVAYDTVNAVPMQIVCLTMECVKQKEPADTVYLSGYVCHAMGRTDVSYRWVPSTYLSSDTALSPLCWAPVNITYTVYVTDNYGCEYVGGECRTMITTSAVKTLPAQPFSISVVPNPLYNEAVVVITQNLIGSEYEVIAIDGKVVSKGILASERTELKDIANLSNGVYIFQVRKDNHSIYREKLIKN